MKIGVDIDGVLCEFVRGYLKFVESKLGVKKNFEDVFSYNLWEVFAIQKQQAFDLADEFYKTKEFDNLEIVEGAKEGLEDLKGHELFFITARPAILRDKTKVFLKEKMGLDGKLIFTNEYFGKQKKSKDEICKEEGIKVLIEDHSRKSVDYARKGINVLVLDKPWNQGAEHENIERVKNWEEIVGKIKEMEKNE